MPKSFFFLALGTFPMLKSLFFWYWEFSRYQNLKIFFYFDVGNIPNVNLLFFDIGNVPDVKIKKKIKILALGMFPMPKSLFFWHRERSQCQNLYFFGIGNVPNAKIIFFWLWERSQCQNHFFFGFENVPDAKIFIFLALGMFPIPKS